MKYVAEQVANDPVGAAKRVAAKAAIYWNENSAGQIGEDVGRVGLGWLAGSGTAAIGGKAIGIVGTGAVAAGRQVAPVAAEMAKAALRKQGFALSASGGSYSSKQSDDLAKRYARLES